MGEVDGARTPEAFFDGHPDGLAVFQAVRDVVAQFGNSELRTAKSQFAFRRRVGFAYVWRPGQYLESDVPAVLSIALSRELDSPRIKEVAHPSKHVWMHHIELGAAEDVDDEIRSWLAGAYRGAG